MCSLWSSFLTLHLMLSIIWSRFGGLTDAKNFILSEMITTPERITREGYPIEIHKVVTDDGYILEIHRVPHGKNDVPGGSRPPVLLSHGLMGSSMEWFLNYPDKALGFILADEGYDVWLLNGRGNKYSRKHTRLDPNGREFWMFSYHEIAVYDIPATIDYALAENGADQISYVGFSLGSIVFYVMMSEKPEYNSKVKVAAMLGPASYMTNSKGTLFQFSPFVGILEKASSLVGLVELTHPEKLLNVFASTMCSKQNYHLFGFCLAIFSLAMEVDREFANRDFLPFIFTHIIAGGSLKSMFHLWQMRNADRFQKYDYGAKLNQQIYGSSIPPVYYISRTTAPVGLFLAKGDKYVRRVDVNRLISELPNEPFVYEVDNPNFSHFDLLWSNDPSQILYRPVIDFLKSYLKK